MNRPEVHQKPADQHFEIITNATPEEFAAHRSNALVGMIVKGAGIKPTD